MVSIDKIKTEYKIILAKEYIKYLGTKDNVNEFTGYIEWYFRKYYSVLGIDVRNETSSDRNLPMSSVIIILNQNSTDIVSVIGHTTISKAFKFAKEMVISNGTHV